MNCVRTLVTGATGYIGSRLVTALLAQGHEVVTASRDPRWLADFGWHDDVSVVQLDAQDEASAPEPLHQDGAYMTFLDMHVGWLSRADYEGNATYWQW